jgi:hypothetical protein
VLRYRAELLEMWAAKFSGWLVSWLVYCFVFAGVCVAVQDIELGLPASAEGSLEVVRAKLRPVIRLSLLLFVILIAAMVLAMAISAFLIYTSFQHNIPLTSKTTFWSGVILACLAYLVTSRFALAMPAVVLDSMKIRHAMFCSDELTAGHWSILAVLLLESIGGSYLAAVAPYYVAQVLFRYMPAPTWLPLALYGLAILGGALIQPTMFIGFAVLYLHEKDLRPLPESAPAVS